MFLHTLYTVNAEAIQVARIPPIDPTAATAPVAEAFRDIEGGLGRVANMYRTAGHAPDIVGDLYRLGRHFLVAEEAKTISYELLRLVHLRVSHRNECNYCATHNAVWSSKAGVPDQKLTDAISPEFRSSVELSDAEKVALAWADAITFNRAKRDDPLFEELGQHFSPPQIVELTLAVAYRNMVNRFVDALQVDVEEEAIVACPISVVTV